MTHIHPKPGQTRHHESKVGTKVPDELIPDLVACDPLQDILEAVR